MKRFLRQFLVLLAAAALAGCSGGDSGGDAGPDGDGDDGGGDQAVSCASVNDCPSHHLCLEGFCRPGTVCLGDDDCSAGFKCLVLKEVCVPENPCSSDEDCPAATPRCLTDSGLCVACREDGDCPGEQVCADDYTCQAPGPDCTSDADCTGTGTPHCDTTAGKCYACVTDAHCPDQVCDPALHQCVECYQDGHCTTANPYCLADSHTCVACRDDNDCSGGERCTQSHQCSSVVCSGDDDCSGSVDTPHCNTATQECVQCTAHEHCGTFQWCRDFICTPGCQTDEECVLKQGTGYHCNTDSGSCYYAECTGDADCSDAALPHCLVNDNPSLNKCVECSDDNHCQEFFYCNPVDHACAPQPCYSYQDPDAKCREVNECYICDYGSGNCAPPTDQVGFTCTYPDGPECCPGYNCNSQGHCEFDLFCDQQDPTCAEGYTCNFSYNQCEWVSCCDPPCGSGEFCNSDCECESGCHEAGEECDPISQNCCPPLVCNLFWPFCTGG